MQYEEKKSLSNVRLANARDCLKSAKTLLAAESYKGAANRSYYAVFHAMRAVLAMDEIDMKHHSGIISEFRRRYIKTGTLDTKLSDIITAAYDLRTDSDYNDFYVVSKRDVSEQVESAEYFLDAIQSYLETV